MLYAFYHRLYLIDTGRRKLPGDYLSTTFWNILQPTESTFPAPLNNVAEAFKWPSWGLDVLDTSALITLIFMTIPIIVVCFLPLWKIRALVNKRRAEELDRLDKIYQKVMADEDKDKVEFVTHSQDSLRKANIWPNGNSTARSYLTLIFGFAAGALSPPLLAIALVVGLSDKVTKFFKMVFRGEP